MGNYFCKTKALIFFAMKIREIMHLPSLTLKQNYLTSNPVSFGSSTTQQHFKQNVRIMTMKKLTLATVALMMTAGAAFAANDFNGEPPMDGGKGGKHMRDGGKRSELPRGFEELNLTDAQKAKIKAIVEADRPAQPAAKKDHATFQQKMQARQTAERQLMSSKTFDENAARRMIAERQQERNSMEREHAERELQMLKKRHAIFQVLTPEQQKQFQAQQQKRMENMKQRMQQQQNQNK